MRRLLIVIGAFSLLSACIVCVLIECGRHERKDGYVLYGKVVEIGTVRNEAGGLFSSGYFEVAIKVRMSDGSHMYGTTQHCVAIGMTVYRECWKERDGKDWCLQFTPYKPRNFVKKTGEKEARGKN